MVGSNASLWNNYLYQWCQPEVKHCCFLKNPSVLNHLNHSLAMPSHPACFLLLTQVSQCAKLLAWELRAHSVPNCICEGLCSPLWVSGKRRGCRHKGKGSHFVRFLLIFRKFTTEPQALKEQCDCHKEQCGKASIHACAALPHAP